MNNYISVNFKPTMTQAWESCDHDLFTFLSTAAAIHRQKQTNKDKLACWGSSMSVGSKSNQPDYNALRLVVLDVDWSETTKAIIKTGDPIPQDETNTMNAIETALRDSPLVWFVYRSFSGGLRFGVLTKSPLLNEHTAKETALNVVRRLMLEHDLPDLLAGTDSINVDEGKLNQKCVWYVPNDPDKIWFRDDPQMIEPVDPIQEDTKEVELWSSTGNNAALAAIDIIEEHGDGFPEYHDYIRMIFAAKAAGVTAYDASRLFRKSPKFDQTHFDKTWSNAKHGGGVTDGTLIFHAKKLSPHAWKDARQKHKVRPVANDGCPMIQVNNRHPKDIADEIRDALNEQSETIFNHDGLPATIVKRHGVHRIIPLTGEQFRSHLVRLIRPFRDAGRDRTIECNLPKDIATFIETTESIDKRFEIVNGVRTVPVIRDDGSIFMEDNRVDPTTRLFFSNVKRHNWKDAIDKAPKAGVTAKTASKVLLNLVSEFPFKNQSSKANYLAFLLTFATRHWYADSPVPACMFTANAAGVGKSTLVNIGTTLAYGQPVSSIKDFKSEQEARKQITSRINEGSRFVLLDNAEEGKAVGGPWFDEMITSGRYQDRLLGTNRTVESTIDAYAVTTNGVKLAADGGRRFYFVELETDRHDPHLRTDFKVKDILAHVKKSRFQLNAALLLMIQSWCHAGQPSGEGKTLGSFEAWATAMDGILTHAGVDGFLDNREEIVQRSDDARNDNQAMIELVHPLPFSDGFYTSTLVDELKQNPSLADGLPEWLSARIGEAGFAKTIGNFLSRKLKDKPILCRDGKTRRLNATVNTGKTRYKVVTV